MAKAMILSFNHIEGFNSSISLSCTSASKYLIALVKNQMDSTEHLHLALSSLCAGFSISRELNGDSTAEQWFIKLLSQFTGNSTASDGFEVLREQMSFVMIPMDLQEIQTALGICDLWMNSSQWKSSCIGDLRGIPWTLDIYDQIQPKVEIALHYSISALLLPAFPEIDLFSTESLHFVNGFARIVLANPSLRFWISPGTDVSSLRRWMALHSACNYAENLKLFLDVDETLQLERWMGEPIEGFTIKVKEMNEDSDEILKKLLRLGRFVIFDSFDDTNMIQISMIKMKLVHLLADVIAEYPEDVYNGYIQMPLQPLRDNLSNATYETFEKDTHKYSQYLLAITNALETLQQSHKHISILILGAGRGPLVDAAFKAANSLNIQQFTIFALEKNKNVFITLKTRHWEDWDERVRLFNEDARLWHPPDEIKVNLLVSELLGSFGCNELSPECIDGVRHCLDENAICIPSRYVSEIAPVSCSAMWNQLNNFSDKNRMESLLVVKLDRYVLIDGYKECFEFYHPNGVLSKGNDRNSVIPFVASEDIILHGFVGHFVANLYEEITISNSLQSNSDVQSWFSAFIPLRAPIPLRKGDSFIFLMDRVYSSDESQVFYQWNLLINGIYSGIHNCNGSKSSMQL